MRLILNIILTFLLSSLTAMAEDHLTVFRLTSENGLPDNNIRYITQDSTGAMVFVSLYQAYQYDGYTFRQLSDSRFQELMREQKTDGAKVRKGLIRDNLGNEVLTEQGEYIVYTDRKTGERIPLRVYDEQVLRLNSSDLKCCVVTDRHGRIWVSVNGNGLFVYDRASRQLTHITRSSTPKVLDANYIVHMMVDRDGHIWVAQEHFGVVCLTMEQPDYRLVSVGNNSINEKASEVRMMYGAPDGNVVLANGQGELLQTDGQLGGMTVLPGSGSTFCSAATDTLGRLWMGSLQGILVDGRWYGEGRADYILRDTRGRMWVCGLNSALKQVDITADGQYHEHRLLTDIEGLRPRTMRQDHRGTIWLGADKGLFAFQPDELLAHPRRYRQVSNVPVRSILEDSRHRLWVGTVGKGLGLLQADSTFRYLNQNDGLPNNVVQLLAEDSRHYICAGTEDGLAFYDPDRERMYCLFVGQSRLSNYFNEDCCVMLADGSMAYGSLNGVVVVSRDASQGDTRRRPTELTDLLVNGISVHEMGDDSPLRGQPVSQLTSLTLAHDQNSVTLRFSDFDYGRQRQVSYTYILEGYDRAWSDVSTLNFATYKNLKPGSYTFRVRCVGQGGQERTLRIVVRAPWWATWWARGVYLLLALAIGFIVYRQLRHVEQLRQRIAVERQLTDFKLKFFTNISHEFRTPLTLIQSAMEKMREVKEIPGSLKQPLSNMQQSTDRMLRLVNQLLEFRRMQNNKLSLALQETDIVQYVYNIYMSFHDVADKRRISYNFIPSEKSLTLFVDRGHVDKMVYNLLSNAFKYTPERGSVNVRLRREDGRLLISVEDTGIGVAEEKRADLFNRFSTGRVSGDSLGIGLNLAQELAHVHHGEIDFRPNDPVGSVFTITLPTERDVYDEADFLRTDTGLKDDEMEEKGGFTTIYQEVKGRPLNDRRILVVDDSEDILRMIQHEMATYFEVDTAANGEEALAKLRLTVADAADGISTKPYELVISDVKMPVMGGYELTRRIRNDRALNTLPVILLTSLTGELQRGLDVGADIVIEKPFSIKALTTQVLNLIDQRDRLRKLYASKTQRAMPPELLKADVDKRFVKQLDDFIEKHLDDYLLSIDMLTEHFRMGRTTFFGKVREVTGYTPNDYIREKRLARAAELLRDDIAITISEVAYKTGFNNAQYLSISFKKRFGVSPTVYQNGK